MNVSDKLGIFKFSSNKYSYKIRKDESRCIERDENFHGLTKVLPMKKE